MIAAADRQAAASALTDARRDRVAIEPLTESWPGLEIEDAYAIQTIVIDQRLGGNATVSGWKVGLTSLAMQQQLGVDQPDFGPLLDDMRVADGGAVDTTRLIAPRVEGELAFRLKADMRGDVSLDEVADAVDVVLPALEIIDSRIVDWRIKLADTIADHASCALYVAAEHGATLSDVALQTVELVLEQDGEELGRGTGEAVLGDPLKAVAWLAATIGAYGRQLSAGDLVLAGALHASVPITPGTRVEARTSDPALGSVSVTFA